MFIRHFAEKHKSLPRQFIHVFSNKLGYKKPKFQTLNLRNEQAYDNNSDDDNSNVMECEFEESLSSESVLKKAQTFLNVLKFKLERNLQHNVFCGLTEEFINFFEDIHNNQSRELIIGCIKDRLKSGRSKERYIQSLPNYVKAE